MQACVSGLDATRPDESAETNKSLGGAASCHHDQAGAASFDSSAPIQWPGARVLHLTDAADAINVSLDADGSVRQLTIGCDFWSCSRGLWTTEGKDIIVTPRAGELDMAWPGTYRASQIRLSLVAPDSVRAVVITDTPTPAQVWGFGRVCAECCAAQLGPSSVYACPGALENLCDDP